MINFISFCFVFSFAVCNLTCSLNQHCELSGGEPRCVCNPGFLFSGGICVVGELGREGRREGGREGGRRGVGRSGESE